MTSLFEIAYDGDCLIVIPRADLGEAVFEQRHDEVAGILDLLHASTAQHLVLDFCHTAQFGSTALGFFVKLWKNVCERKGRMAFCNLSPHETEVLHLTKLNQLWDMCDTREDALKSVRGQE